MTKSPSNRALALIASALVFSGLAQCHGQGSPPDDPGAFKWHPDDLRIPLGELKLRYDPEVWRAFEEWSRNTLVSEKTTVWNWLSSKPIAQPPTRADRARIDRQTIDKKQSEQHIKEQQEYADPENIRQDSQRFFTRGHEAFGQLERIWGTRVAPAILRPLQEEWSAQVAAVATGRKPLFHESFGDHAVQVAASLRKSLPSSVEVRAYEGQVFVYRPGVVHKLADPAKPLWNQVLAHSDDGVWLGYGVNRGSPSVTVNIVNDRGAVVSGFLAPVNNPEPFARARTQDFTLATGKPHQYVIVR